MKHLKIENIRILADTFLLLHEDGGKVYMRQTYFHPCGTVACHAGWFAVARGKKLDYGKSYTYMSSADEMAKFLGLKSFDNLPEWAHKNPKIWGNHRGEFMFSRPIAFGKRENQELTLKDIGIHWHKIADRLEELNNNYRR